MDLEKKVTQTERMKGSESDSEDSLHGEPKHQTTVQEGVLSSSHPQNPQSWTLLKKLYTSTASLLYTFTLFMALTAWAPAGIPIPKVFKVTHEKGVLCFSLMLLGIAVAPLYTPHIIERVGKRFIFPVCTVLMSAFLLGAAYSPQFNGMVACRFLAGLVAGPIVVANEGIFADLWNPRYTTVWYSFLTCGEFIGASMGPSVLGPIIQANVQHWKYLYYIPLMFAAFSLAFGAMMPETSPRQIARQAARKANVPVNLPPSVSGETASQMIKTTVINPFLMFWTEPLLIGHALMLGINFGIFYGLFMGIPSGLLKLYHMDLRATGLVWTTGIVGTIGALISNVLIEMWAKPYVQRRMGIRKHGVVVIEHRLVPGIVGVLVMYAGFMWIGWTATPKIPQFTHVVGDVFTVWGQAMSLMSAISYMFDCYPRATSNLSAITSLAVWRRLCGVAVSLVFLDGLFALGGAWFFTVQSQVLVPLFWYPGLLMICGPYLRSISPWSKGASDESPLAHEYAIIDNERIPTA